MESARGRIYWSSGVFARFIRIRTTKMPHGVLEHSRVPGVSGTDPPLAWTAESLSYMDVTLVGFHPVSDGDELATDREAEIESTLEKIATESRNGGFGSNSTSSRGRV